MTWQIALWLLLGGLGGRLTTQGYRNIQLTRLAINLAVTEGQRDQALHTLEIAREVYTQHLTTCHTIQKGDAA